MMRERSSSVAALLLVSSISSAFFSGSQLLKKLMYSFHCDSLTEKKKKEKWFR